MLAWVAITAVVLPMALLLTVPFSFALLIKNEEKLHFESGFSWLWGVFRLKVENSSGTLLAGSFALKRIAFKRANSKKYKFTRKQKNKFNQAFRAETFFDSLHYLNSQLIFSLIKVIRQILASLSIKLKGEASFGFDNPALTGLTYGFMAAIGLSGQHPGLKLTPDFLKAGFEGFLSVRGRFTVGKALFVLVAFLLSRPARHLWWPRLRKEVFKKWRKSTLSTT